MRQAGRYLPEYRALKEKHSFIEMVKTPEIAAEVTLQPLKRFPLDAAILFSDILVIPEALGQSYSFREQGGIEMSFCIEQPDDLKRLDPTGFEDKLKYVTSAMQGVRQKLGPDTALLGFAGSPLTLASYMLEGGSSKDFAKVKQFALETPEAFYQLLDSLTDSVARLLNMMIDAGADTVQIFDSWGALCPGSLYWDWSLQWVNKIIQQLPPHIPVILYAKGMASHIVSLVMTGASVISLDWTVDLAEILPICKQTTALQGNLDPCILNTTPKIVTTEALKILNSMLTAKGYIFNLGHGIMPSAKIENVEALVKTVTEYRGV